MSLIERSYSLSVLPPTNYRGYDFRPLPYAAANALRRVTSSPNLFDRPYMLSVPHVRSPYRLPSTDYKSEFGDYLRDRRYFGERQLPPHYFSWPVRNYMHLDTGRSIVSAYNCWSEARRTPTYTPEESWYQRGYRYDKPKLREYRTWVEPVPEGSDWKSYIRQPSNDSFLHNHWVAPYKYEAKLNIDYRQPYEYRYNYYVRPHIYYHHTVC